MFIVQGMFIEILQGFMLEKVRETACRKTVDSYRLEDSGFTRHLTSIFLREENDKVLAPPPDHLGEYL